MCVLLETCQRTDAKTKKTSSWAGDEPACVSSNPGATRTTHAKRL